MELVVSGNTQTIVVKFLEDFKRDFCGISAVYCGEVLSDFVRKSQTNL